MVKRPETGFRSTQGALEANATTTIEDNPAVAFLLGQLRACGSSGRSVLKGQAEQILCNHGMSRSLARETLEIESKKGKLWLCQKRVGGDGRGDPQEIVLAPDYVFPDEVDRAVRTWKRICGRDLDPRRVKAQISYVRKWEANRERR